MQPTFRYYSRFNRETTTKKIAHAPRLSGYAAASADEAGDRVLFVRPGGNVGILQADSGDYNKQH
ncbi:MAG: hypothetical protein WC454_05725 [Phycisphaerae bacterium]|jgi:hypothetical protein